MSSSADTAPPRPAGLDHLDQHLFGPAEVPAADATGLSLIEAPGPIGELRLVARRIRSLLTAGVRPESIVVTERDLANSADLVDEVFADYGLPVEIDVSAEARRNPAAATLLRAMRVLGSSAIAS